MIDLRNVADTIRWLVDKEGRRENCCSVCQAVSEGLDHPGRGPTLSPSRNKLKPVQRRCFQRETYATINRAYPVFSQSPTKVDNRWVRYRALSVHKEVTIEGFLSPTF